MKVYLDHAATTPLDKNVLSAMTPYFTDVFGNQNSLHSFGRDAEKAVINARTQVANAINSKPNEVYFTSGGTEGDNWALIGAARANKNKGNHIIISKIEHAAILSAAKVLESEGFTVTYLDVDEFGIIDLNALKKSLTPKTILVSIMSANNEIGTLQPIKEAVSIVHSQKILFHTDAVQAAGAVKIDVADLGVDLLTISAHKFYGPKGVGALYIKSGVKIDRFITGGHQERSMRGGTTNVPAVVGLGQALTNAVASLEANNKKIQGIRDYFEERVLNEISYTRLNGHKTKRLPSNCNISFEFIEGESILQHLDFKGIAVSTGSACSSGSLEPSHVIMSLSAPVETAHSSIRFSFGKDNTKQQADYVIDVLKEKVEFLRKLSPLFVDIPGEKKYV